MAWSFERPEYGLASVWWTPWKRRDNASRGVKCRRRRDTDATVLSLKREALKRANQDDITDVQVCKELGISARQLRRWRDEVRLRGKAAFPGKGYSHNKEITQLKREPSKVNQERVFLREAVVLFARESN